MMPELIIWIEHYSMTMFNRVIKWEGCKVYNINHFNHLRITFTNCQKYHQLGGKVLRLTHIYTVVVKHFLGNIF